MPTYQYECAKCGEHFDLFQSMKDAALKICPPEKCGRKPWGRGKVSRILGSGAGLIFKGSGFYITDYRSEGYKTAAQKESAATQEKKGGESGGSTPSAKSDAAKPLKCDSGGAKKSAS
jgi:putative FmdB family regulatory protein